MEPLLLLAVTMLSLRMLVRENTGIKAVHVGKFLEIELDGTDKEAARTMLNSACHKFLSNPLIEDFRVEIE